MTALPDRFARYIAWSARPMTSSAPSSTVTAHPTLAVIVLLVLATMLPFIVGMSGVFAVDDSIPLAIGGKTLLTRRSQSS